MSRIRAECALARFTGIAGFAERTERPLDGQRRFGNPHDHCGRAAGEFLAIGAMADTNEGWMTLRAIADFAAQAAAGDLRHGGRFSLRHLRVHAAIAACSK
jgi:hypothetical protein